MRSRTLGAVVGIAVGCLALAPRLTHAAGNDDLIKMVRTVEDAAANLHDREQAISQATTYAQLNPGNSDPLKQGIERILKELEKKKSDASFGALVELTFHSMDPYEPFPNVGPIARGYLAKEADPKMRMAALTAIAKHGASGLSKDMIAIFDEPTQIKDRTRENLEECALKATLALPGGEAEKILEAILKNSKSREVQLRAYEAMGELVDRKPPNELDESLAKTMLMTYAVATNPDEEVGCKAALALTHWGTWDGVAEVMKRCNAAKRGPSRECYKTICTAAHKLPGGFAGVTPAGYITVPPAQRSEAVGEMLAWWDKVKGGKPDATLFDALTAAGVKPVPKDTSVGNKEAIAFLIAGLEVPNRTLRNDCLDLLVKRTGKADLAKDWRLWIKKSASSSMTQEEPPGGYPENDPKANDLYELQKQRAKKWKAWWDQNSSRATLVGGVWKVS